MGYTRNEIVSKCTAAFGKISTFYKQNFVNYKGLTSDTKELFTEVIAEFLCDNIDEFKNGIPTITRESSYRTPGHDGVIRNGASNREEDIAMQMYGKKYDFVGKMIDYQTPLKSERSDKAGKIDLLTYDGSVLRILELKKPKGDETMLRCVLEGFTYLRTVDKEKLLENFELPRTTVIRACPFVFKGGVQYEEMHEPRPQLKRLMALLDSKPYYITKSDDGFIITED